MNWHRSTYCANTSCIDVAVGVNWVHVRDTDQPVGPYLTFGLLEWQRFVNWAVRRRG